MAENIDRSLLKSWHLGSASEFFVVQMLRLFAIVSIFITVSIVLVLVVESFGFFTEVTFDEFLFGLEWTPLFEPRSFGVIPIVFGTIMIAGGASLISVPLGLLVAVYLSEYANDRFRGIVKPVLEVLAGIPSVVFGYFAITAISPFIRSIIPETEVFNAASAAIVVAFMTLPMVTSVSDDALRAVPQSVRDGAYALGTTKLEVIKSIVIPAAASGIVAAFILAFSRAIGETMAVTLAAGATPNLTLNPLESIQTMTAYIVQVSLGDTPHGTIEYQSIFAVGLLLFFMTLTINFLARYVIRKIQAQY